MFELDHLMIEVDDPQHAANHVSETLGLPLAWPLTEKDEYTSIGVNFGDINIEFIRFRVRFGIQGQRFNGLSGVALKTEASVETVTTQLDQSGLSYRIGETCEAHTTLPIEENQLFPTVFVVKYHFNTSGWLQRLQKDFTECQGGKFHITRLQSLSISPPKTPLHAANLLPLHFGESNRITFESRHDEETVIVDLIENLEVVIMPRKQQQ
ncbi:hypothetical protein SBX64_18705 [Vibrio rhizosphaerae]|uniref:Glyoxalase-like domain-containing protein n=1 Tax=Vibrio rhizosphaerae TaxID=398736 RepID=A0ABU4IYU9_9VIBR|nr:hypothetical protein [Vibrio rhizosphaerae]MDW6094577.1 hypothetical protein [Vibrio rhizosphaerae]